MRNVCDQFDREVPEEIKLDEAVISEAWRTYSCGILFKTFDTVTDKVSLRNSVMKATAFLEKKDRNGVKELPPALQKQIGLAKTFKCTVAAASSSAG